MATFYISCYPQLTNLTGRLPLGAYLCQRRIDNKTLCDFESKFNSVTEQEFGILTGEGDDLSNTWEDIESRFQAKRLTKNEFIGAARKFFVSGIDPITQEERTFEDFLTQMGFDPATIDVLACVKEYKSNLFKEISKKRFCDDNDSLANISKTIMLTSVYSDTDLTSEQKTRRNALVAKAKAIYTQAICLDGMEEMLNLLEGVLVGYYMAKTNLEATTTVEGALAVVYE